VTVKLRPSTFIGNTLRGSEYTDATILTKEVELYMNVHGIARNKYTTVSVMNFISAYGIYGLLPV
jgi:hypothetical protein